MNRDHSVIFETAFKSCISNSYVDYEGFSISSKGFLPTIVDIMVIRIKFFHSGHFGSPCPKMLMCTLSIPYLTTSNLPWFMDLIFQVPMQYCSSQHWTLLPSPVASITGCWFCLGSISSFFLELFLHSSPVSYWTPTDLVSSSFSVLSFHLFILFMVTISTSWLSALRDGYICVCVCFSVSGYIWIYSVYSFVSFYRAEYCICYQQPLFPITWFFSPCICSSHSFLQKHNIFSFFGIVVLWFIVPFPCGCHFGCFQVLLWLTVVWWITWSVLLQVDRSISSINSRHWLHSELHAFITLIVPVCPPQGTSRWASTSNVWACLFTYSFSSTACCQTLVFLLTSQVERQNGS